MAVAGRLSAMCNSRIRRLRCGNEHVGRNIAVHAGNSGPGRRRRWRVPITQANSAKKRLTKLLRQCTHHKSGIPSFQLRNPRAGHTLGGLSLLLHRQRHELT
jgi:hypothetical protein